MTAPRNGQPSGSGRLPTHTIPHPLAAPRSKAARRTRITVLKIEQPLPCGGRL